MINFDRLEWTSIHDRLRRNLIKLRIDWKKPVAIEIINWLYENNDSIISFTALKPLVNQALINAENSRISLPFFVVSKTKLPERMMVTEKKTYKDNWIFSVKFKEQHYWCKSLVELTDFIVDAFIYLRL